jgi:hypothetical protein
MRKAALAAYAVVLVLFAGLIAVPYLDARHDTPAEVPSPEPLAPPALDLVPAGGRLCMSGVGMTQQAQEMRFRVGSYGKPGPSLVVTIQGRGYSATTRVPGGWPDNLMQRIAVRRPSRDQLALVCIRNAGRTKIALYAASDTARSRVAVKVDGQRVGPTPGLAFYGSHETSIADNASVTAGRVAVFRGFLGHAWIVWTLAILFIVGTPVVIGVALWRAADEI